MILVTGSANLDFVVRAAARIPTPARPCWGKASAPTRALRTASGAQSRIPTALKVEAFLNQQAVVDPSRINALRSY